MSTDTTIERRLVGYRCTKDPDGGVIPPSAYSDPCPFDERVYEDLMPDPPAGFAACRVHDGRQSLLADGATRQVTHLVALDEHGSNGGRPTVCGLTRFDSAPGAGDADLPGWSMGGGVMGVGIIQAKCEGCWT